MLEKHLGYPGQWGKVACLDPVGRQLIFATCLY